MEDVSGRRRDLQHLHNTQNSHETGGHVPDGIQTRNHTKPAALDRAATGNCAFLLLQDVNFHP
jgi:hypothetical protein